MNEQLILIYSYLYGMWRYRWSALFIAWLVAVAGWVVVFAIPDQYSAKAVVYADTSSIMKPLLKGLAPESDAKDELSVMTRILLSRNNLLSVIRKTDMDLGVNTAKERDDLVDSLARAITLKGGAQGKRWGPRSNIYEIDYTSTSANLTYQVVSDLLNTMIEDTLKFTRMDTASAQKFLGQQITDYEKRLSSSEQKLAQFKKSNVGYMPDEKGSYYTRLQNAQNDVEKTRSSLNLARQRMTELKKQLRGESPLLDTASYQAAYIKKLQKYQARLSDLLDQYTDKYPDVIALKAKIADLKTSKGSGQTIGEGDSEAATEMNPVYQEMKVQLSKAGVDIQILKTQLAEKKKYVQKLKGSIDIIPEVEAKLAKLNRDYEVTKKRYLELVERRESAQLAQSAGQSTSDVTFRIIESPTVPTEPSGPNRILLFLIVLVAALGAGLGWGFLRFILQPTFFNVNQLGEKTGLPVLGTVGLYVSKAHKRSRRLQLFSFFTAVCLLFLLCGGVLIYSDQGTHLAKKIITEMT